MTTHAAATAAQERDLAAGAPAANAARWAPLTGVGFVVFFLASVVVSSPPADSAPAARWVANYTGHGHQLSHEVTGVLLVLAALSLMSFLVMFWSRIGAARERARHSAVPLVAAGVSAASIAAGGVLMASGSTVTQGFAKSDLTGTATVLRFVNDAGFTMVAVPGMLAAALAVAMLSVQARRAGLFGPKLTGFGVVVAVILLASLAFVPIVALMAWLVVTAVILIRRSSAVAQPGRAS